MNLPAVSWGTSGPPHLSPTSRRQLSFLLWCPCLKDRCLTHLVSPGVLDCSKREGKPEWSCLNYPISSFFTVEPSPLAQKFPRAGSMGCPWLPCAPADPGGTRFSGSRELRAPKIQQRPLVSTASCYGLPAAALLEGRRAGSLPAEPSPRASLQPQAAEGPQEPAPRAFLRDHRLQTLGGWAHLIFLIENINLIF